MPFSAAKSMQYQRVPLERNRVIIAARGPIVEGDLQRLTMFFSAMPNDDRILAISLDSEGGNIFEAEKIASRIHAARVPVIVETRNQCSSACFLLFAASPHRYAAPDALFGVHSVSMNGDENLGTLGFTAALARDLAAYGVPPAIVRKMVETPASRRTWLTPADLQSMGVTIFKEETASSASVPSQPAGPPSRLSSAPHSWTVC